jgi:hypothetical protein
MFDQPPRDEMPAHQAVEPKGTNDTPTPSAKASSAERLARSIEHHLNKALEREAVQGNSLAGLNEYTRNGSPEESARFRREAIDLSQYDGIASIRRVR